MLHGLGGIGKTQLCVEYARRNQHRYSAILWLNGSSDDSLKRSIAEFAASLSRSGRNDIKQKGSNSDGIVQEVLSWLSLPHNRNWLLIFDNVDRDHLTKPKDPQAYDVARYFPWADHGSILITSRLETLRKYGTPRRVLGVNEEQARLIIENELGRSVLGTCKTICKDSWIITNKQATLMPNSQLENSMAFHLA